jgi:hypothetical protein
MGKEVKGRTFFTIDKNENIVRRIMDWQEMRVTRLDMELGNKNCTINPWELEKYQCNAGRQRTNLGLKFLVTFSTFITEMMT